MGSFLSLTAFMTLEAGILWIPALPLLAFVLIILVGRRLGRASAWISVAALAGSGLITWSLLGPIRNGEWVGIRWLWLSPTESKWAIGLAVDELSWLMLCVVTLIGTLIQIYSIGYMRGDARFTRFFAYLSLFCASMLGLVMADNFVLLYACWELVGLCSYLLISFWFEKPEAAAAGRKAFLTTRIGDVGLLLGILLLAFFAGDLHFASLETIRLKFILQHREWLLTITSALIFLGAVGKSAQIPLHVWLPDAMEGPTPVSALIHAATMVAAGVYLVARALPLFTPESLHLVLTIGLLTHLLAATVALTMTDIKRILAYSTISQLGLMMVALGLGAKAIAMFHLFTHAFFKALLFLGAGSVIHATHKQDLKQLGGVRRYMPWTAGVFLIATLSMSGIPLLSGFWSKDAILIAAGHDAAWLKWVLLAGAVMTAGYIFRLYVGCFHGCVRYKSSDSAHASGGLHGAAAGTGDPHEAHQAESPIIMVLPMVVLAVGAAFAGLFGSPVTHNGLFRFLGLHDFHEGIDIGLLLWSAAAAGVGFFLVLRLIKQEGSILPMGLRRIGGFLYRISFNKYYVDEFYARVVINPFMSVTRFMSRFDLRVIDETVNRAGRMGSFLSFWKNRFDQAIIDRFVNEFARCVRVVGSWGRRLQTGVIHQYLLAVILAAILLAAVIQR